MIYGYARVSSPTQSLDTQVAQLTAAGCEKIFHEKLSGGLCDFLWLLRTFRY